MRFLTDGTERHRAGSEAFYNFLRRFHFVQRNGIFRLLESHQTTQSAKPAIFTVDLIRVFLKCLEVTLTHGALQRANRLGVQQVVFAVCAEVVVAAYRQFCLELGRRLESVLVPHQRFPSQNL